MEAMDRVEKKERADAFVEIRRAAPERIERRAFIEQFMEGSGTAMLVERAIADRGVRRSDERNEAEGHGSVRGFPARREKLHQPA